MVSNLTMVASKLKAQLGANFLAVNVRLMLRTGVDLTQLKPGQAMDAQAISKVAKALQEMGIVV